jgi:hypothetical protein
LVQAYLNVNGHFTVTEYPVVEAIKYAGYRTATDLDVLAFRFPGAGRLAELGGKKRPPEVAILAPDAALGSLTEQADMIIGEVKEGRAELNQGAKDPAVLRAALTRFGCCEGEVWDPRPSEVPNPTRHGNRCLARSRCREKSR